MLSTSLDRYNVYRRGTYIKYRAAFCQSGRSSSFEVMPATPGTQKQQNGASITIETKPASIYK